MEKIVAVVLVSTEDEVSILGYTSEHDLTKEDKQKISDYFNQEDNLPLLDVSAFNNKLACNISEMLTTLFKCNNIDDRKAFKKDILDIVSEAIDEIM